MHNRLFPLTAKYDEDWVMQNSIIENVLYYVESLCEVLRFEKGMRVLDLASRNLHFPKEFFDVVIALEYSYFGTDEWYLPYISQFLKSKGLIGIVDWCYTRELNSLTEVPEYLKPCYQNGGFHSLL